MNSFGLINFLDEKLSDRQQIGIFCSGGFDSTILLYTLFKIFDYKKIEKKLFIFTVPRYDASVHHANNIVDWLKSVYPECKYTMEYPGNPDLHHSQQVLSGIKEVLAKYPDMQLFLGDTQNPDQLFSDCAPVRVVSSHDRVFQPFINYKKTTVLQIAKQFDILDKVSQLTHTCTESQTVRCRKCWQCMERAWAFKQTNFFDVGLM